MLISEAAPSKACTVFYCSNTAILGSDPTRRIHEMCSMCVFFLSRQKTLRNNKFYRTSKSKRREENQLDAIECFYCTYSLLNMFRPLICPSSGARDYTCVIAAYGV